nr:MAG TPA: hypothetical protein [Caudoviricetes sp.]
MFSFSYFYYTTEKIALSNFLNVQNVLKFL